MATKKKAVKAKKTTPPKTEQARAAVWKWQAYVRAILENLAYGARQLQDEVERQDSPFYGAATRWGLKELIMSVEDAQTGLLNADVRGLAEVKGIPSPLGDIGPTR